MCHQVYRLDGQGSILSRAFLSLSQMHSHWLQGPLNLLPNGYCKFTLMWHEADQSFNLELELRIYNATITTTFIATTTCTSNSITKTINLCIEIQQILNSFLCW